MIDRRAVEWSFPCPLTSRPLPPKKDEPNTFIRYRQIALDLSHHRLSPRIVGPCTLPVIDFQTVTKFKAAPTYCFFSHSIYIRESFIAFFLTLSSERFLRDMRPQRYISQPPIHARAYKRLSAARSCSRIHNMTARPRIQRASRLLIHLSRACSIDACRCGGGLFFFFSFFIAVERVTQRRSRVL